MPKPPTRNDSNAKLEPTRESETAKSAQVSESQEKTSAGPLWVLIVGIIFLGLAVLFFMGLIVANMRGSQMPDRGLVCIVLALTISIGSGFLGGSAAASGDINVSSMTPVKFGVTGGVAVFIITLILCHYLYNPPPQRTTRAPEPTKIDTSTAVERLNIKVEHSPGDLSSQDNLYAAIATDKEFKYSEEEKRVDDFCRDVSPCFIQFSKPQQQLELWLRFVVKTPDGKVAATSQNPKQFKIPK